MNNRRGLWAVAAVLLAALVTVVSAATRITPHVRNRVVTALNERFDSEVELKTLQVSIFPRVAVEGEGLVIRHKGRRDVPPLIQIDSFAAGAGLFGLIGRPLHLHDVQLQGLRIHLPPGGLHDRSPNATTRQDDTRTPSGQRDADRRPAPESVPPPAEPSEPLDQRPSPIVIDRILSAAARLEIASSKPGKPPRIFDIHHLDMHDFAFDRPATFQASLRIPKPQGDIDVKGRFGPWQKREPRRTPLEAEYVFKNADLATTKGISGILSSVGRFGGVLERIDIQGTTDTPDFSVDKAGHKVPLHTSFKAVVDGTNGDTYLTPVEASFLQSVVVASGAVVRAVDVKGRTIALDVQIDRARLEDVLKFAIKSSVPPMTGALILTTKLLLPAGDGDVVDRLQLDGRFDVARAEFTSFEIQKKVNALSRRGRGETEEADSRVVSNFKGQFRLRDEILSFSDLSFSVPGATVQLAGSYSLASEALDFKGHLLLDAPLSKTTTGVKAALAKIAQPLFRREGGGSKLPIKISGTRSEPAFGLDVKRALTPG